MVTIHHKTVGHRRHHDGFLPCRVSLAKNEEYIVFRVKTHTSRKTQLPRFRHGIFSPRFGARPVWQLQQTHWRKMYGRTSEKSRVKTHSTKCTPSLWHNYLVSNSKRRSSRGPNVCANKCSGFPDFENATKRLNLRFSDRDWLPLSHRTEDANNF